MVFASELACVSKDAARVHFHEALASDIAQPPGGATAEGIHLGAMSGTIDIIMRRYAGINTHGLDLVFSPYLPEDVHSLRFRMQHLGNWYHIDMNDQRFRLTLESGKDPVTSVLVNGNKVELIAGKGEDFPYEQTRSV